MTDGAMMRKMTLNDLDSVLDIEQQVFADPWSRKSYEFELSRNRFSYPVVLEKNGEILGYSVIWKLFGEFHIASFAITPVYQRQGWGRFLMEKLMVLAEDCHSCLLEVRRDNIRAIALYESFGFVTLRVRPRYYRNGQDALVMRKMMHN